MVEPARDLRFLLGLQLGPERRAGREAARAARMERTTRGDRGQPRHRAGDLHEAVALAGERRDRAHQAAGVGVQRLP